MSLSNYRNQHHRSNAAAKRFYAGLIAPQVRALPKFKEPVALTFTMYPPSKRRYDLDNWGSVTAKFFQDTLVAHTKLTDDDSKVITRVTFVPGGVDTSNPRIEITIESLEPEDTEDITNV